MNDYDVRSAFEEMELELISSMKRNLSRHQKWETKEGINWSMWQAEQLKTLQQYKRQNKKIFTSRFSTINHQISELLKDTYQVSGFEQERAILKQVVFGKGITEPISIKKEWFKIPIQKRSAYNLKDFILNKPASKGIEGGFFSLNEDKMNALIHATTKDMTKAEHAMLRMADDQYRKIIFDAQVMANSGAFTLSQAIDKATRDFLKAGINCITYKDGKRVNIAAYAEMNIRTATKRAKLISEGEARKALGVHTVKVSKYGQCSKTCLPWQGKVYVDDVYSGGTKEEAERLNLPLLSTAIAGGLFHPNCKHIMTTYFYDLKKSLGKLQEDGAENPPEEQEHRKNQKYIQQQERLATGLLDQQNIQEATMLKNKWLDKDKKLIAIKEFDVQSYYLDDETVRMIVAEKEDELVTQSFESAFLYGENGTVILSKNGLAHEVEFTDQEMKLFKGNVLTHNHPRNTTFSPEDVYMLKNTGLQEIRAAVELGTYTLKWNSEIEKLPSYDEFVTDFKKSFDYFIKQYLKQFPDGMKDLDKLNVRVQDANMNYLAKKYKLDYSFEERR